MSDDRYVLDSEQRSEFLGGFDENWSRAGSSSPGPGWSWSESSTFSSQMGRLSARKVGMRRWGQESARPTPPVGIFLTRRAARPRAARARSRADSACYRRVSTAQAAACGHAGLPADARLPKLDEARHACTQRAMRAPRTQQHASGAAHALPPRPPRSHTRTSPRPPTRTHAAPLDHVLPHPSR